MYGLVNKAIKQFVIESYDQRHWLEITKKASLKDDVFLAMEPPAGASSGGVKILPGVCSGKDGDGVLCVYNDTKLPVQLNNGDLLAIFTLATPETVSGIPPLA